MDGNPWDLAAVQISGVLDMDKVKEAAAPVREPEEVSTWAEQPGEVIRERFKVMEAWATYRMRGGRPEG